MCRMLRIHRVCGQALHLLSVLRCLTTLTTANTMTDTRGLLARSFPRTKTTTSNASTTTPPASTGASNSRELLDLLNSYSSNPIVSAYTSHFCQYSADTVATAAMLLPTIRTLCNPEAAQCESELVALCTLILYDCIVYEKLPVLSSYLQLLTGYLSIHRQSKSHFARNCWAVLRFYSAIRDDGYLHWSDILSNRDTRTATPLLQFEFLYSLSSRISAAIGAPLQTTLAEYLRSGALPNDPTTRIRLLAYLNVHNLPSRHQLASGLASIEAECTQTPSPSRPAALLPSVAIKFPALSIDVLLHLIAHVTASQQQ
jgi:hypothetical protein